MKIAIHHVNVWRYNSDELLASLYADKKSGGVIDLISKKHYVPTTGEVSIVR